MITVFANKALLFRNPRGNEEAAIKAQDIKQMPDWIVNDPLFNLAKIDGSITAMEGNKESKKIENGDFNTPGSLNEKSNEKSLEDMSVDELKVYAEGKGIDIGRATSQSGILEKIQGFETPEE